MPTIAQESAGGSCPEYFKEPLRHVSNGDNGGRFPAAIAAAWANRVTSPPVSLATKLGIDEGSAVVA